MYISLKNDLKKWIFVDDRRIYNWIRRTGMNPTVIVDEGLLEVVVGEGLLSLLFVRVLGILLLVRVS